jgi:RimJ/RimL family protein N-acetyltransferase
MDNLALQTERLVLRRWLDTDRDAFVRMNADPRVMEFFPECLTREQSDSMIYRIEKHFDIHGFGLFAAELRATGELVGFVGLAIPGFEAFFTPCVEIGWRLGVAYWNQGLATEGAHAVLEFAFTTVGLLEVVSFTTSGNLRSRRVMEKLGMQCAGDFEHPRLPEGHPLRPHVLYRLANEAVLGTSRGFGK